MTESGDQALDAIARRYDILRQIGRGGMGRVFLVHDRKDGREKALKMLHPEHMGKDWLTARFIREAKVTRLLDHPGVVKLYGAYRRNGTLFYTMEYVPGKNLRAYLGKTGTLNFASTVHILCLVARALDYTHQFAIHRDLSPENIMVVPDGSIRIIDFGLTRLNNDEERLTLSGTGLGKIQYHAPEQDIDASKVDTRADVFPLGVMMHEMLTGQRPDPDVPVSVLRPGIPAACDDLLRETLAEDPEGRLPTARAFHDRLLAIYEESRRSEVAVSTPVRVDVGRRDETPTFLGVTASEGVSAHEEMGLPDEGETRPRKRGVFARVWQGLTRLAGRRKRGD